MSKHPKLAKTMPVIIATVKNRRRTGKPRRYAFTTPIQSEVENAMMDMGYGCNDYVLWYGNLTACETNPFWRIESNS